MLYHQTRHADAIIVKCHLSEKSEKSKNSNFRNWKICGPKKKRFMLSDHISVDTLSLALNMVFLKSWFVPLFYSVIICKDHTFVG